MSAVLPAQANQTKLDIYGFIMLDGGYNADQIQPDWYDTVRPTKLPSFTGEFAPDGNFFYGVRQTRFGIKSTTPTSMGDLFTQFEFEMFGTGVDAGQTTIRLRHAYGELGKLGAGQYWSPFMDIDVFPNSVEYWGPTGMAFFRNVQVRYMPIKGDTRMTIALERPGASADQGVYAGRVELQDVKPHFPYPDLSAEYRYGASWGYIEVCRYPAVDGVGGPGHRRVRPDRRRARLGHQREFQRQDRRRTSSDCRHSTARASQNYMNDAPVDVGIENQPATRPRRSRASRCRSSAWSRSSTTCGTSKYTTSVGYSMIDIDNSDGQAARRLQARSLCARQPALLRPSRT